MYEIIKKPRLLRPRERLTSMGAEKLSEQELLAIILRTGTRELSATQLADQILKHFENLASLKKATIEELQKIKGVGPAKAIEILAMIELGKRIQLSETKKYGRILNSRELGNLLIEELSDLDQEHLVTLYLDTKNNIIRKKVIFIGTVNSSTANPREILYYACKFMATSIIISHNHPSGDSTPSGQDHAFTEKINQSCDLVGINLLDHIVVGHTGYYSYKENNMLP
ncbi:DNA repair protein RadC [Streptococcaceae bacterium ESL0687]|nr:DNA repair protein RadC [Streptococcaceae bacterium ESL0687]